MTAIHNMHQTKRRMHSNFCTFKFHIYLISYTKLFTKLNLFEILLYVTFITMKISLGWYLGNDDENNEINQTVSNIICICMLLS